MSQNPFSKPPADQQCREISGMLFNHPCEHLAKNQCQRCGKPICVQHTEYAGSDTICISCTKQSMAPEQGPTHSTTDTSVDPRPYWYIDHHYDHYSWRDDDFTEADESVLLNGDDDAQWEQDMGAS